MEMIYRNRLYTKTALFLTLFFVFIITSGQAKEEGGTKLSLFGEIGFEYTDNVFRLTDDQISTMDENDPDDIISGRYQEMDSLSDSIFKPRVGIKWKSDSPLGGKFRLTSWLRYHYYLENDDSSYSEYGIALKNSIGKKGDLTFDANLTYGFRKKNYLSSASDMNGNGNISRDERTYSAAVYDEYEGEISYRHEVIDDKDKILSEFYIKPFAGYKIRSHNSSFTNRDKDSAFGGLEFDFEFLNRVDLEFSYTYENVSSPGDVELVLFDETRSGTDVNGDSRLKKNAALYTDIDRSSESNTIQINPTITVSKDIKFSLGYSKRTTDYTSGNPLDIEHYNQNAYREKYEAGISFDLSKTWFLKAEYCRTDDEDPEDGTYNENSYLLVLRYSY